MSMSDSFEKFTVKISDLLMVEAGDLIDSNLQNLPEFDGMARIIFFPLEFLSLSGCIFSNKTIFLH